jgi:hypothetical protein
MSDFVQAAVTILARLSGGWRRGAGLDGVLDAHGIRTQREPGRRIGGRGSTLVAPARDVRREPGYGKSGPGQQLTASFMGLIVLAMGVQFGLSGLESFFGVG